MSRASNQLLLRAASSSRARCILLRRVMSATASAISAMSTKAQPSATAAIKVP
jgi:hypothetical protein